MTAKEKTTIYRTKPLIFLDIDGVLNIFSKSYKTLQISNDHRFKDKICRMEYHLVKRLEYLIDNTDAYIILISAWDIDSAVKCFKENDFKYCDRVINKIGKVNESRIVTVRDFCYSNKTKNNTNFVMLDDEILYDEVAKELQPYDKPKVIEVNMTEGLSEYAVLKAIQLITKYKAE